MHLRLRQVTLGSLVLACKDVAPTMAGGMLEHLRDPIRSHWTDHRPDPIVN